ncbi:MAG: sigma-54-dependent Fis family transcriptional regulator, partial [Thermoguttaceae bacterium]|nr:sigma-54-dependent Fis family transcriptional regulator [Thermoguttaceae bacterium]
MVSKSGSGEETGKESLDVLVIDDEPAHADVVAASLERIGAECIIVHSEKEAFQEIEKKFFDVVVTDLMLEQSDGGLTILKRVKERAPETEVIVMTAFSGVETAVEAMREGAFNYLQKPLDLKQLRTIVEKAGESARLRRVNRELQQRLDEKFGFDGVIGSSPAMLRIIERVKRIAPTDASVLILGETGTGKELFAQSLHQNSNRKNKPFVALNCAALSENILESELFGHVKGAFTDATSDRTGKFEYANGGTIFLDEVGDMPMPTQVKLLRVLENGEITRVGSNDTIKVNVRLLSATNQNLEEAVENNLFRRDLYHRLKVVTLRIPSLRERSSDIPVLLDHFLKIFTKKYNKKIRGVSQNARRKLFLYDWPGNVRQLRNVAESMVVVDFDGVLDVDDLPDEILEAFPGSENELGKSE